MKNIFKDNEKLNELLKPINNFFEDHKLLKDVIDVVLTVLILTFILINFILMPVRVDGESMYNTLIDGDFGYSFVITKNLGIKRFDISIIDVEDKLLVKRVIGLPNEKVSYYDNKLYINDEYIEEDFLNGAYTDDFEYYVGDNEYFCLGDNRQSSRDSRYYGPFNKDKIKATHIFVVWPFNRLGIK